MKHLFILSMAFALSAGAWANGPALGNPVTPITVEVGGFQLGQVAPMMDREMLGVDGQQHSIQSSMGERGLLVVFSCNTCPFVVGNGDKSEGWEGRYMELSMRLRDQGFGMILVNSNEAKREGADSYKAMQAHAEEAGYRIPYLVDEQHELADAFGAMKTPHVYLLDASGTLVYTGAIDDNVSRAADVKERYVLSAVKDMVRGLPVEISETPAVGCSIKRVTS
jgi:hypothetical protein